MTRRADDAAPEGIGDWPAYRIFGLVLASDFPFANRLLPASAPPDLTFTRVMEAPVPGDWAQVTPVYVGPGSAQEPLSTDCLYRFAAHDVLRFAGLADFYLWADRIVCHLLDPAYDSMVEIHLLGSVLSFWLERRGIPVLHASAVVVGGQAVAFLATHGGGKSSLAAALMQAGHPLLTDDLLPVEDRHGAFLGRPGYPQMRMWPEEACHFLGDDRGLERVHPAYDKRRVPVGPGGFGVFCDSPRPLARIYLPERRHMETRVEILPVSPRDALLALLRHSFTPRVVEAIGLQPQRLDAFSRIVRAVPVRRLRYPSGLQHLGQVREALLHDMGNLGEEQTEQDCRTQIHTDKHRLKTF